MLPLPALLIRFEIEKAGGAYSLECYGKLFAALDKHDLDSTVLFDGDTRATLEGRENVNMIAIQCADYAKLESLKTKLEGNAALMDLTARPAFTLTRGGSSEPLVLAGNYSNGAFDGGGWPAAAFKDVEKRRASETAIAPAAQESRDAKETPAPAAAPQPAAAQPIAAQPAAAAPAATVNPQAAAIQPAPADPAKAAKSKRTLMLALAAVLAAAWCALACLYLPGAFKTSPVNYSASQLAAELPNAVVEACRRTGRSNAYIEALLQCCEFPDAEELESMIGTANTEENKGKPYQFEYSFRVPIIYGEELTSVKVSGADSAETNAQRIKSALKYGETDEIYMMCLVDYDGIYFEPTLVKEAVADTNLYIEEAFGVSLESAGASAEEEA